MGNGEPTGFMLKTKCWLMGRVPSRSEVPETPILKL